MKLLISLCLFLVTLPVLAAEPNFTYLQPKDVPGLPVKIVTALEQKHCLVPKWRFKFGGVTRGEFAVAGQKDIAVICTRNNDSKILIFWGGTHKCPSEIGSVGQFISTVGKSYILEHYEVYGGNKPPKITHQGIDDAFVEKASVVRYCHNGTWIDLTGAD